MERIVRERKRPGRSLEESKPASDDPAGKAGDEEISTDPVGGDAAEADISDRKLARLRTVALMEAEYRPQYEIAERLGISTRQVRNLSAEARRLKLGVPAELSPEEAVADCLFIFDQARADLLRLKRKAEEAGDHKLVLNCIDKLGLLEARRLEVLRRIGLFDDYVFAGAIPEDPHRQRADALKWAIGYIPVEHHQRTGRCDLPREGDDD